MTRKKKNMYTGAKSETLHEMSPEGSGNIFQQKKSYFEVTLPFCDYISTKYLLIETDLIETLNLTYDLMWFVVISVLKEREVLF